MSHVTPSTTAPDNTSHCTMYRELVEKYGLPNLEAPSPPPSDGFPDLPTLPFEIGWCGRLADDAEDWLCDEEDDLMPPISEVGDVSHQPEMSRRQWRMLDALICL